MFLPLRVAESNVCYFLSLRQYELCYWIKKITVYVSACVKHDMREVHHIAYDVPHAGKYCDIFQKLIIDDKISSKLVSFVALFQIKIKEESNIKI